MIVESSLKFFSKKLNETMKKYPAQEKEALATLTRLNAAQRVTLSNAVIVETDYSSLVQWATGTTNNICLARWQPKLCSYNAKIRFIKDVVNVTADLHSRMIENKDVDPIFLYNNMFYEHRRTIEVIQLARLISMDEFRRARETDEAIHCIRNKFEPSVSCILKIFSKFCRTS